MDTTIAANLEHIVSAPRFHRYRNSASSDLDAVVLYCWNIQLAESLLPTLALFEVTLRNAVHTTLTNHYPSIPNPEFWFKSVLHQNMYKNVTDLIDRLTRRHGVPPTAGKVISEITFGFWPLLFAKRYNALWWSQPNPLIANVIPQYPKIARDTRSKFEARLEYFVKLRNRVMHHEAIFQGVASVNHPVLPIDTLHDQLIETLGWINQDAVHFVTPLDHFNATFHHGKSILEADLRQQFRA